MTINRRGKKKECNFIMPIHVLNAEKKIITRSIKNINTHIQFKGIKRQHRRGWVGVASQKNLVFLIYVYL